MSDRGDRGLAWMEDEVSRLRAAKAKADLLDPTGRLWLAHLERRQHELDCRMAEVTHHLAMALDDWKASR